MSWTKDERIIKETQTFIDADGNETISEVDRTYKRANPEPEYIKLYTDTWCEFNQIPVACRPLFLELVTRMSFADSTDEVGGQIVFTGQPVSTAIQEKLHIKKSMYSRRIKELVRCGALRQINRGCYQINANYAGKGEWHYNPTKKQGGIENIITKFNFADKSVETHIIWGDDGKDDEFDENIRRGLGVTKEDEATLQYTTIDPKPEDTDATEAGDEQCEGQMAIIDTEMHTGTEN